MESVDVLYERALNRAKVLTSVEQELQETLGVLEDRMSTIPPDETVHAHVHGPWTLAWDYVFANSVRTKKGTFRLFQDKLRKGPLGSREHPPVLVALAIPTIPALLTALATKMEANESAARSATRELKTLTEKLKGQ